MSNYIPYFELAAWVASLLAWPKIRSSPYFRLFPFLLFIVVLVESWTILFYSYLPLTKSIVYNVQVPLQHLLYLAILYLSLKEVIRKKFILILTIFFLCFSLITTTWFTLPDRFNVLSYCLGSFCIIVGILIKFYEMLENPSGFNFLKQPLFHILFSYLLFNLGTLPYFVMSNWLYFIQSQKEVTAVLINVMTIFNYILYSTYTFVFLWMSLKKVHS